MEVPAEFYQGVASAILDRYAPYVEEKIAKKTWMIFQRQFDKSYNEYLYNAYENYSRVKTVIFDREWVPVSRFFICPDVQDKDYVRVEAKNTECIFNLAHSNSVIIQGKWGSSQTPHLGFLV